MLHWTASSEDGRRRERARERERERGIGGWEKKESGFMK